MDDKTLELTVELGGCCRALAVDNVQRHLDGTRHPVARLSLSHRWGRMAGMAYDEAFAERVRSIVGRLANLPVTEKRMFGGLGFLLNGNMAVAVQGRNAGLLVRIDPDQTETLLAQPGAALMAMSGRSMRGWLTVEAAVLANDTDLRRWIKRGIDYATTLPAK